MEPNRRRSARVLVLVGAWLVPCVATAEEPVKIIAGPMFVPADEHSIHLWLQTDRPAKLRFRNDWLVQTPHKVAAQSEEFRTSEAKGTSGICSIRVNPGESYKIRIWEAYDTTKYRENRPPDLVETIIKAPPAMCLPGKLTIAFGSCSHQERFDEHQPIWEVVARQKPDCFLFIGDNIYLPNKAGDFPKTREEVLEFYCDTYDRQRRMPELQPVLRSTMSFALWDDHDYGPNNSDRTWKWKDVALEAFNLYFPGEYGLPDAPGCFHKFAWGDIDVFMLDDRTYRDPNDHPDRRTFLGERQLAWLKEGLAASKATFKLVVAGNQMLSDTHPHESWGIQFRPERDALLDWLWERKTGGVIFLAGDRHFAELVRKRDPKGRGPDLWELTSSPLANEHYQDGPSFANPERVASYAGGVNVGVLKFDTTAVPPRVELNVLDVRGTAVIRQVVTTPPVNRPTR